MHVETQTLHALHSDIKSWITYAETKNAALGAINLSMLAAGTAIFLEFDPPVLPANIFLQIYLTIVASLLILSTLICLSSAYPQTVLTPISVAGSSRTHGNHLFFGHIADMGSAKLTSFFPLGEEHPEHVGAHHRAVIEQVVVNSRIASRKFAHFKWACAPTISAVVTPLGFALIYWGLIDEVVGPARRSSGS
jgi:hypothetical protein